MQTLFHRFWTDVRGASAVEYALICGLIGMGVAIAASELSSMGQSQIEAISNVTCAYGPAPEGEDGICADAPGAEELRGALPDKS